MKPLTWLLMAALAGTAMGCSDENVLYTSDKYVPGYRPHGETSIAMSHLQARDSNPGTEWRER